MWTSTSSVFFTGSAEVEADLLGDEWKGYVLRDAGGNEAVCIFSCPRGTLAADHIVMEIPGLTNGKVPRHASRPQRASEIRKLFNLSKEDDVSSHVVKRVLPPKEGKENAKPRSKAQSASNIEITTNLTLISLLLPEFRPNVR
ncbi:LOW QUALITY PROTEIN: 40S ribosomal protein S6-like [Leguminivora glycinivorella]|uniref:LOW QUALITY PROTEIN: 40S ribosomal protein S6-like n=1 Tax=Leguminivora glycinivorella TaxID=1035111 RepID=UPI0020100F92|nr:LOW QUALITY PROTEIN: 40S ribosomal protein S6-like [Leguminivora glycinivorella]